MAFISVIVPIYNSEDFLSRCLDSLLNQSYKDFNIICVDDCGTDRSKQIAQQYAHSYPNIITLVSNPKNLGAGMTKMRGLQIATSPYVMFVDSDDYVSEDYLATYASAVISNNVDVVVGGYTKDIDGRLIYNRPPSGRWSLLTYTISCAKLFRRNFLMENSVSYSDSKLDDILFSASVYCSQPSYSVIEYGGYHYVLNRSSTTSKAGRESNFEELVISVFTEILQRNPDLSSNPNDYRAIEYFCLANIYNSLIVHSHGCGLKAMKNKVSYTFKNVQRLFPDYLHNPFISLKCSKGQIAKIRYTIWLLMHLRQIHLDIPIFYLLSLI